MKVAACLFLLLCIVSCSQKGEVTVRNSTPKYVEVDIEGEIFVLGSGDAVIKEINIGRKFIFGPSGKTIAVEGFGDCVFPFVHMVKIKDDENKIITITGNAGTIRVCNLYDIDLPLYLVPCGSVSWEDPVEIVWAYECAVWIVEPGCWSVKLGDFIIPLERHAIDITVCAEWDTTWSSSLLTSEGDTHGYLEDTKISGYRRLTD